MEMIQSYFKRLPQNFWLHNYLAAFLYYILVDDSLILLALFPVAVALIHFVLTLYHDRVQWDMYIGFQNFEKTVQFIIIALIANLIIYKLATLIVIGCIVYHLLKNSKRI